MTTYQLVLFQTGRDQLDRQLVSHIQQQIERDVTTPREESIVDIWLQSPGGDANATVKLYWELRSKFKEIRIAVPDYAKSAATLLAIGADKLFVSPAADFGPLDVQVEHADREGRVVSALAGANSIEHLAKVGIDLALLEGPRLFELTPMKSAEVLREMLNYSATILEPILSKLDPQLIHEAAEQLKVTRDYAQSILLGKNNPPSSSVASDIANTLVTKYPTHGYVVTGTQLDNLGVPVKDLSEHPDYDTIKRLYTEWSTKHRTSIIQLFSRDQNPF